MEVTSHEAKILKKYLATWKKDGKISPDEYENIVSDMEIMFPWKKLAKISVIVSLVCLLIGITSFFFDERILRYIMSRPAGLRATISGLLSVGLFYLGYRIEHSRHAIPMTTPIIVQAFASVALFMCLWQCAVVCGDTERMANNFLLLGVLITLVLGWMFSSSMIWFFTLVSFGTYLGMETGYVSGWGAYFLGMNYPFRFFLAGCFLLLLFTKFREHFEERNLYDISIIFSLLYVFLSLWILSIFGMKELDGEIRSLSLDVLFWSLVFGILSVWAIIYGYKTSEKYFSGFGFVFLGIELFTKYFEYFWNAIHKAVFFIILGIILACFARYHAKIRKFVLRKISAG